MQVQNFSVTGLCAFILYSLAYAETSEVDCSHLAPNRAEIPLCPANGMLLDETYPIMAAVISDNYSDFSYLQGMSLALLEDEESPPIIVASVNAEDCARLKRFLNLNKSMATTKISAKFVPEQHVVCSPDSREYMQRDLLKALFDANTGLPVVIYNNVEGYSNKAEALSEKLTSLCGITAQTVEVKNSGGGAKGGNIDSIPPALCVIGDGRLTSTALSTLQNSHCGRGATPIVAPTSFLDIGHADEIIKTVKTAGPPPCNFRVMVSDPSLAIDLLKGHQESIFDLSQPITSEILEHASVLSLCNKDYSRGLLRHITPSRGESRWPFLYLLDIVTGYQNKQLARATASTPTFTPNEDAFDKPSTALIELQRFFDFLERNRRWVSPRRLKTLRQQRGISLAMLRKSIEKNDYPDDQWTYEDDKLFYIERLRIASNFFRKFRNPTPEELRECLNGSQFADAYLKAYGDLHQNIDDELDKFAGDLERTIQNAGLKDRCGETRFVVRVPDLYVANTGIIDSHTNAYGMFPSAANAVMTNHRILFSDSGVLPFKSYLNGLAENWNAPAQHIYTWKNHLAKGNLHCMTNTIRYCRPRTR